MFFHCFLPKIQRYLVCNEYFIVESIKSLAMSKKTVTQNNNHKANQLNPNKGTSGTNKANGKANGNRGKQLNPNNKK